MAGLRFQLAWRTALLVAAASAWGSSATCAGQPDVESVFEQPESPFLSAKFNEIASALQSLGAVKRAVGVTCRSKPSKPIDGTRLDTLRFASEKRFRFRDDAERFLPQLRDDARGVVNWNNAAILGSALAVAIAFRQDLDADVRANTARHPERWDEGSETLGLLGEAPFQIPVLAATYGLALHRQDDRLHDFTSALVSAYTINGLSTLAMKGIANTDRPSDDWNGGQFGFPSFHASGSFTIAAVVDEYYGPEAGLPAYALAGLIGWSRIDQRDHDLSDVVFGAAVGFVIGKSVAGRHLRGDSRVRLLPYVHPGDGTSGLMLDVSF